MSKFSYMEIICVTGRVWWASDSLWDYGFGLINFVGYNREICSDPFREEWWKVTEEFCYVSWRYSSYLIGSYWEVYSVLCVIAVPSSSYQP